MDPDAAENAHLETSMRSWLASHLPAHAAALSDESLTLHELLKSGVILCEMMNIIKPGSMKKISTISTAYKQLENVQNYLNMCRIMGMQASQLFESSDLVNGKFKSSILINLKTLQGIHERYSKPSSGMVSSNSSSNLASTSATTTTPQKTVSPSSTTSSTTLSSTSSTPHDTVTRRDSQAPTPTHSSQTSTSKLSSTAASTSAPSTTLTSSPSHTTVTRRDSQLPAPSLSTETGNGTSNSSNEIFRNKTSSTPDEKTVALVQRWIEVLLTTRIPAGKTLFDWLKSGVILLRVLNAVKPDICKTIYTGPIGFKQIENVQRYLKLCPIVASSAVPLFSVADLTDESDLTAVLSHLHAMITIIQRDSKYTGPTLDAIHHAIKIEANSPRASNVVLHEAETDSTVTAQTSLPTTPTDSHVAEPQKSDTKVSSVSVASPESQTKPTAPESKPSSAHTHVTIPPVAKFEIKPDPTEEMEVLVETPKLASTVVSKSTSGVDSHTPIVHAPEKSVAEAPKAEPSPKTKESHTSAVVASPEPEAKIPPLVESNGLSEIEKARRELESERLAIQEERRLFAERIQAETERRIKEMAAKMEEETAAVLAKERRHSVAMTAMLEEERKAREAIAAQLEEERKSRKKMLEETDREKEQLALHAQKQIEAVAERLQEETSKKLEAMASKLTTQAEQELRKKDEHLMKQLDRERMLRSRLEALEDEKKSLSKTFERKFAALESELKAAKTTPKISVSPAVDASPSGSPSTGPNGETNSKRDSGSLSPANLDPATLKEFKEWHSKWRSNRMLTKQLTRTLTEMGSSPNSPTPRRASGTMADVAEDQESVEPLESPKSFVLKSGEEESDSDRPLSLITPRSDLDLGSEADEPLQLDLDKKQWLDDDWSEEEDWESENEFDDDDESSDGDESSGDEGSPDSRSHRTPAKRGEEPTAKKSPKSPSNDEWSEFSTMNLSRFS